MSLPELNIPDIVLPSESEHTQSDSSEISSSKWSVPTVTIDDTDIPAMDSENFWPLDITDGDSVYDGAWITTEQAMYMLVSWFSSFPGVSKTAFNQLLYILHSFILPTKTTFRSHMLIYTKI